jgi:four helix bundle protein
LRRAAVSIPSNIAEGQGRRTDREFANFVSIANSSLYEAETQIIVANRLKYLNENQTKGLLDASSEVGKLLHGLARVLEK